MLCSRRWMGVCWGGLPWQTRKWAAPESQPTVQAGRASLCCLPCRLHARMPLIVIPTTPAARCHSPAGSAILHFSPSLLLQAAHLDAAHRAAQDSSKAAHQRAEDVSYQRDAAQRHMQALERDIVQLRSAGAYGACTRACRSQAASAVSAGSERTAWCCLGVVCVPAWDAPARLLSCMPRSRATPRP